MTQKARQTGMIAAAVHELRIIQAFWELHLFLSLEFGGSGGRRQTEIGNRS
jgi:hypothetical protein